MGRSTRLHSIADCVWKLCFAVCLLIPLSDVAAQQNSPSKKKKSAATKQAKKKYLKIVGEGPISLDITVRVEHKKKVYYGRPFGQDLEKLAMLRWDGRITVLPRQDKLEIFSKGFAPYSSKELESRLLKQYGKQYLTQSSKHFTVVYPRTKPKNWAQRYETVYRQFKNYLARHKIELKEPQFPMIVVVLGSRREFDRALSKEIIFKKNIFGFYARNTNRVTTYVSSDPRIARQIDQLSDVTIIHEAIHQVAFNTELHNRLCTVPRWMSEGFAMLFESRGFRNSKVDQPMTDRINKRRLATLKQMFRSGRARGTLETLIRNDRIFETNADLAYSLAWGLSFYLAEKETDKYLNFVKKDGNKNEFRQYTPDERITFFVETFATDFDKLEKRLRKFILALP